MAYGMKTIYLIRHGKKVGEYGDPELTQLGHEQARQTGQYLAQLPITHLITSPSLRTRQTAEGISAVLGLPVAIDDRLVERMDWSDSEVPYEEFCKEWFKATHERGYVPMWGDSSLATGKRIAEVIADFDEVSLGDDVHAVLVSHGGAIIDYLRSTFGDESVAELLQEFPGYGWDYEYKNCAVTKVVIDTNEVTRLVQLHFLKHLD